MGGIIMRKKLTEIVFILDRSGSMSGLESDTIGGFNSMIAKQKKQEGEALVSTVLFDNVSEVIHDRVSIADIQPMTDEDYTVRGCTALLDAIGGAIHHIGNIHKYARAEDVPEHTLFIITTDGMENASRFYTAEKVKQMIERQKSKYVGLSNILDNKLVRRKPAKGSHREVVGAAIVDSELLGEVMQGVKAVTGIKTLLVLPVASLHLAIVARCVGTNELVADTQLSGGCFKESRAVLFAGEETVGELNAVIGLDALHADAPAGVPLDQLFQEVCGGIGGLLRIGGQETQAGELVNSGVLVKAQLRVGNAATGDHLYIHLDPLSRISHLLVGLWLIDRFLLCLWEHPQLSHDPEQAFRAAGIAPLPQSVPQLYHA